METKKIICPYCKAPITKIGIDLGKVTCEYCDSTFIIQKENETHLEKFFRVWHEEDKRRAEYMNSEDYKKVAEEDKKANKVRYIMIAICLIIIFICIFL